METLIVLVPALPLLAAVLTAILGPLIHRRVQVMTLALPTILALSASFLCSVALVLDTHRQQTASDRPAESYERVVTLWTWMETEGDKSSAGAEGQSSGSPALAVDITLRNDALTAMMLGMVTLISTLVAIYSIGYMEGDRSAWRYFTYIPLFVFSMTMLVSVSNFVLLFVFWEAVGVCSYLLIGFWYEKPPAVAAGMKAFLVNRIGDFGFTLALFLIWVTYGTLTFHDTATVEGERVAVTAANRAELTASGTEIQRGVLNLPAESYVAGGTGLAICLLLMLGACGKSAQLPLHVWLPDAMEGPTPVSALIHAATMVTAGVYMVVRCTPLFMVSPAAQLTVAVVGGLTALIAGLIALTQYDLKRVLAYSTVSQLGYMFLALGTGTLAGVTSGMFHLFTHAFFKALLFLGAGSVMHSMGHVIDMRRFGGLKSVMPLTHATFLVGCLALAGVFPLAGFWSKDGVVASVHDKVHNLEEALAHRHHETDDGAEGEAEGCEAAADSTSAAGGESEHAIAPAVAALSDGELQQYAWIYQALYYVAMFSGLLTAFYTFRALSMTFYGDRMTPREAGPRPHESPAVMTAPLIVLAVFAVIVGFFFDRTPYSGVHVFADYLAHTPQLHNGAIAETLHPGHFHLTIAGASTLMAAIGIAASLYLYLGESSEISWLSNLMKFQWLNRAMDAEAIHRLKNLPRLAAIRRGAERLMLGWLLALLTNILLLLALVLAAPLMFFALLSPYRLSYRKFYFDELYQLFIVRPLELLARVCYAADRWLIDGLVNSIARIPPAIGDLMRTMQTGLVQFYAVAMIVAAALLFLVKWLTA